MNKDLVTFASYAKERKPDVASVALSLDYGFCWSMIAQNGDLLTGGNMEVELRNGRWDYYEDLNLIEMELKLLVKLAENLEFIVLKMPFGRTSEQKSKRIDDAIQLIKEFCGQQDIPFILAGGIHLPYTLKFKALRLKNRVSGLKFMDCDYHKGQLSAIETLLHIKHMQSNLRGETTDLQDAADMTVINVSEGGAL